ncbi:helix-turn-helix domain-containing protein [Cryptosporangium minutisporangium]|uniref:Helix-turn-helix transcriptional regulator n=1 Tax=Cryptosporangium minutisporangium TaxID=113569 RepID=A0ABP6T734_9ACTN
MVTGLERLVRCAWEQHITAAPLTHRVIPDNCADILVGADGNAQLVGPATGVDLPHFPSGTLIRGLRFEPFAIRTAFGVEADELTNRTIPLDAVLDGRSARLVAEAVWLGVGAARPGPARAIRPELTADRRESAAAFARLGVRWRDARPERATVGIVRELTTAGTPSVDAVADRSGYSPRHLRRLVRAETGLTPKTLHRVARVHAFLRWAEEGGLPVGAAAAAAGYADQPHASREIRALTGLTPRGLLAERAAPVAALRSPAS